MRERAFFAAGFCALGAAAACSTIIGTRDLTLVAGDASIPPADANTPTGDGTPGENDASTPDGSSTTCGGADLQTDSKNCGTCGHDCLGGACMAGACKPVTLAGTQQGPWGLALSATNIYWSNFDGDQIVTAAKDGSGLTVIAQNPTPGQVSSPIDVQTDDTSVYWMDALDNTTDPTDVGRIARCPLAGCGGAAPQVIVTNIDYPEGMKVDATKVYWIDSFGEFVASANKVDGKNERIYALSPDETLDDLVPDPAFIYWSTDNDMERALIDAGGPDGGAYNQIYAPGGGGIYPNGLAVDDAGLYFAGLADPGFVQAIPKAGVGNGQPTTYATGLHNPYRIALDATNVYWLSFGPNTGGQTSLIYASGSISTCPKAGCPASGPIVLAQSLAFPKQIAVDDVAIYWTIYGNNPNTGAVMRLAK